MNGERVTFNIFREVPILANDEQEDTGGMVTSSTDTSYENHTASEALGGCAFIRNSENSKELSSLDGAEPVPGSELRKRRLMCLGTSTIDKPEPVDEQRNESGNSRQTITEESAAPSGIYCTSGGGAVDPLPGNGGVDGYTTDALMVEHSGNGDTVESNLSAKGRPETVYAAGVSSRHHYDTNGMSEASGEKMIKNESGEVDDGNTNSAGDDTGGNVTTGNEGLGSVVSTSGAQESPNDTPNDSVNRSDSSSPCDEAKPDKKSEGETDKRSAAVGGEIGSGGFFECNICFEDAKEPVVTRCGHLFCWICLLGWMERRECPVCKAGVTKESVIPIYGRGSDNVDPRIRERSLPRPHAQRMQPPPPRPSNGAANLGFSASSLSFGVFPFGIGITFGSGGGLNLFNNPANGHRGPSTREEQIQQTLSAFWFILGLILILYVLFVSEP